MLFFFTIVSKGVLEISEVPLITWRRQQPIFERFCRFNSFKWRYEVDICKRKNNFVVWIWILKFGNFKPQKHFYLKGATCYKRSRNVLTWPLPYKVYCTQYFDYHEGKKPRLIFRCPEHSLKAIHQDRCNVHFLNWRFIFFWKGIWQSNPALWYLYLTNTLASVMGRKFEQPCLK